MRIGRPSSPFNTLNVCGSLSRFFILPLQEIAEELLLRTIHFFQTEPM